MAVPVNRGRWTAWTDGIYLDANTGDVWVVASARGTHAEASSLAVDDAIRRWSSYVNLACPASAQITSGNVRSMGAYAKQTLETAMFAGWPEAEILRQIPPCGHNAKAETYVSPDEARRVHRVLWRVPANTVVFETLERWQGLQPGERRPLQNGLRNHIDAVRAILRKEGRSAENPLK